MSAKLDWNMQIDEDEDEDDPDPVEKPAVNDGAADGKPNADVEMEEVKDLNSTSTPSTEEGKKSEETATKKLDKSIEIINLEEEDEKLPSSVSKRRLGDRLNVETVIDLAQPTGNSKCVNGSCRSNAPLRKCPGMCLSYYRVRSKSLKHEICETCYEETIQHYDQAAQLLIKKEVLYEHNLPAHNELFAIEDSDEENDPNMTMDSLKFVIENVEDIFTDVYKKYDIKAQVKSNLSYLKKKVESVKESADEVDTMFISIQKRMDAIRKEFYAPFQPSYKMEVPIEINDDPSMPPPKSVTKPSRQQNGRRSGRNVGKEISYLESDNAVEPNTLIVKEKEKAEVHSAMVTIAPTLPSKGALQRPCPQVGDFVFASKIFTLTAWNKASILEIFAPGNIINDRVCNRVTYRIKLENKQKIGVNRFACGQEIAYINPSSVRLEVGTRVVALFKDSSLAAKREAYFPGIIAEPLLETNDFRYLIFFDDGYAQYVWHNNVHVVVESSKNVWEDVHTDSRQFIRKYLEMYPERPMVKLQQGQVVRTEWNGKWLVATVLKVEGSLVQMYFDADARSEWIYRGSTRLNPMFKEELAANNRLEKKRMFSKTNTPQVCANLNKLLNVKKIFIFFAKIKLKR